MSSTLNAPHPYLIATYDISRRAQAAVASEDVLGQAGPRRAAKEYCDDVEFSPEDGSRSDVEFMAEVVKAAIAEGATTINIPARSATRCRTSTSRSPGPVPAGARTEGRRGLGPLPRRPGHGGGQLVRRWRAGARQVECAVERDRRARRQRGAGGDRDVLRTRRSSVGLDTGIVTREIARTSGLQRASADIRSSPTRRSWAATRSPRGRHPPGRRAEGPHDQRSWTRPRSASRRTRSCWASIPAAHCATPSRNWACEIDGPALNTAFKRSRRRLTARST